MSPACVDWHHRQTDRQTVARCPPSLRFRQTSRQKRVDRSRSERWARRRRPSIIPGAHPLHYRHADNTTPRGYYHTGTISTHNIPYNTIRILRNQAAHDPTARSFDQKLSQRKTVPPNFPIHTKRCPTRCFESTSRMPTYGRPKQLFPERKGWFRGAGIWRRPAGIIYRYSKAIRRKEGRKEGPVVRYCCRCCFCFLDTIPIIECSRCRTPPSKRLPVQYNFLLY